MDNILLNTYEFDSPWAHDVLGQVLDSHDRVVCLTMSHGEEIPDAGTWEILYGPGGKIRQDLTKAFGGYAISPEQISFVSWYHDTPVSAKDKILESEILFLTGGLPDLFCSRILELGLGDLIRSYAGTIIGVSAGAMIQFSEYHITPDEDYDTYQYQKGLGLLDGFELEVHYTSSDIQRQSIERYLHERGKTVYAAGNSGGVLVSRGKVFPFGDVTVFSI